jgi:hypothetical protein
MFGSKKPILAAAAGLALMTASASGQPPRHRQLSPVVDQYVNERPPLIVRKRSYLDPGNVPPEGQRTPNYVKMSTILSRTPDQVFNTAAFGNDRLPRPLEVPGRPSPILEFETPAYPYPYPW